MIKKIPILIIAVILASLSIALVLVGLFGQYSFRLNDEYYNNSEQIDITSEEYNELIDDKKSFILFIDQTNCITANGLRDMFNRFTTEHPIQILRIMWPETAETNLRDSVHYFPSVVLINNGKIVDALQADSDEYTKYYNSYDDFSGWLTKNIVF